MKRKIAAALSIVMIGASYAAPFVQAAEETVEGTGKAAYVDDSVLTVVVPTDASLSFTLDPQGLVHLGESSATEAAREDLEDYSGRILGNNALIFANKSLKDVTVTTKFKASSTKGNILSTDASKKALSDAAKADESNKANLIFMAVPNKTAIALSYTDTEIEAGDDSLADIDSYSITDHSNVWASKGVVFGTSDVTTKSRVKAADFKFTDEGNGEFSYKLVKDSGNSAAGFVIAGFCNPYYNAYDKLDDVKVTATYSFAASTDAEKADTMKDSDAFALLKTGASNASILDGTPATNGVVTSIGGSEVAELDTTKTYDITKGDIKFKVTEFADVTDGTVVFVYDGKLFTLDADDYTFNAGTFTIKSTWTGTNDVQYRTVLNSESNAVQFAVRNGTSETGQKLFKIKFK